ncbi:MAG: hypothetical protein NVS4B11_02880 [Ktedonobacteraceae bacterium]
MWTKAVHVYDGAANEDALMRCNKLMETCRDLILLYPGSASQADKGVMNETPTESIEIIVENRGKQ